MACVRRPHRHQDIMRNPLSWAAVTREQRAACLALFDANCP